MRLSGVLTAFVLAVGLGGCSGSDEPRPATASASPSADPQVRVVEVTISAGQVDTAADQVEVECGDTVRLVVTSDVDDEVHVHGVDLTVPLVAGEPTPVEFTVEERGVFEVETHDTGLLLVQLLVR